jgi:preprotein translocase subunit SecF
MKVFLPLLLAAVVSTLSLHQVKRLSVPQLKGMIIGTVSAIIILAPVHSIKQVF